MKKVLLSTMIFLSMIGSVFANGIDDRCPQFVIFGAPISSTPENAGQYLCRPTYAVHYSFASKTAEYVVEHVTVANITGTSQRKDDFRPDPEVPPQFRATLQDYAGQPYDRGHMSPAGNATNDAAAMSLTFLLSNMVPQVPNNNRGVWKQIETLARTWVSKQGEMYIITGTINTTQAKVIGKGVVVPDWLFKIVVDPKSQRMIAFMLPNVAGIGANDYPKYIVSIAEVEKATGILFFPKLPPQAAALKTTRANLADWPR
jgi:endonuclease G